MTTKLLRGACNDGEYIVEKGFNDGRAGSQGMCIPIDNSASAKMQEQQARLHQNLQRCGSSGQINF
jgi:hypothetical protein